MPRRRHHKAEDLSTDAARIVVDGLAAHATYEAIAAKVLEKTGEEISKSAVARYHSAKWRPQQQAATQATQVAELLIDRLAGLDDSELARAMKLTTAQKLLPMLEGLAIDEPKEAAKFFAALDWNRIEEAKLASKNRELELARDRLQLERDVAEGKLAEARRKAEDALKPKGGKPRTREQLEQTIRDLYGITTKDHPPHEANRATDGGRVGGGEKTSSEGGAVPPSLEAQLSTRGPGAMTTGGAATSPKAHDPVARRAMGDTAPTSQPDRGAPRREPGGASSA